VFPFLKIGTTAACFHNEVNFPVNKMRLKMWLKRGVNISEQPFVIKLGISSGPTHFAERRRLMARLTSEAEIYGIFRKSEQVRSELFGVLTIYMTWNRVIVCVSVSYLYWLENHCWRKLTSSFRLIRLLYRHIPHTDWHTSDTHLASRLLLSKIFGALIYFLMFSDDTKGDWATVQMVRRWFINAETQVESRASWWGVQCSWPSSILSTLGTMLGASCLTLHLAGLGIKAVRF
jgi:hypothetical protein